MSPIKKPNKTLNARVFSLVFIPSALLMIAFILIQLSSETKTISSENIVRARVVSLIAQEKLAQLNQKHLMDEELNNEIRSMAKSIEETGLIDSLNAVSADGSNLFTYQQPSIEKNEMNLDKVRELIVAAQIDGQKQYTVADPKERQIDIYLPVRQAGRIKAILKVGFSMGRMSEAFKRTYASIAVTAIIVLLVGLYLSRTLSKQIVQPLIQLNEATQEVAAGNFSKRVHAHTGDEIELLADTFNQMAEKVAEMKLLAENANPLTHLPGNIAIESNVRTRLRNQAKFVVIHADLDNFKAYNDAYGIEKGDQAIKLTAQILKESVEKKGGKSDFLGHEGGDDFVLVVQPNHSDSITTYIIAEFDRRIKSLYSEEDRQKGYIMGHERRGSGAFSESKEPLTQIPLMSLSLAGISNEHLDFASYAEITNRLVEMKHAAKATRGSVFICKRH